jgi:hypothetical protein
MAAGLPETAMLTLTDCASLCVLDPDDIVALAEFDAMPDIAGAMLEGYLADAGCEDSAAVCRALIRDIRGALDDGLVHHATELVAALRQFLEENPQAAPGVTLH